MQPPSSDVFSLQLEEFQGPLDLLLQLVERRQLDVTRVALAAVTDQYLAYLESMNQADLDAWSSFLVIGSRLLYLKSVGLLPAPPGEPAEEESSDELVKMLEEYRRFKAAAEALREHLEAPERAYPRPAPPSIAPRRPVLSGVTTADLARALQHALERVATAPTEVVGRRSLTVQERILRISGLLADLERISFKLLLDECRTRVEVIVTFLALLESLKRGAIQVEQATLFGEILISRA